MGFRADLNVHGYVERLGYDLVADTARGPVEVERPVFAPRLRGRKDWAVASTETALEPFPPCRWDVNGYYRMHGVSWPYRATKAELRLAHHERGLGDPRMTHALSVLINPETRRDYDARPLGEVYMADPWVQAMLKHRAAQRASRESARHGEVVTPADVLRAAGMEFGTEDLADQGADSTPEESPRGTGSTVVTSWCWAYYQYRSSCDDSDRLGRWQEMLVRAFAMVGRRRRFAVGFVGRQASEWVAGEVHGALVVFLSDRVEPYFELAMKAARSLDEGDA